jgi:hypothetical protein
VISSPQPTLRVRGGASRSRRLGPAGSTSPRILRPRPPGRPGRRGPSLLTFKAASQSPSRICRSPRRQIPVRTGRGNPSRGRAGSGSCPAGGSGVHDRPLPLFPQPVTGHPDGHAPAPPPALLPELSALARPCMYRSPIAAAPRALAAGRDGLCRKSFTCRAIRPRARATLLRCLSLFPPLPAGREPPLLPGEPLLSLPARPGRSGPVPVRVRARPGHGVIRAGHGPGIDRLLPGRLREPGQDRGEKPPFRVAYHGDRLQTPSLGDLPLPYDARGARPGEFQMPFARERHVCPDEVRGMARPAPVPALAVSRP